MRRAAIGWGTEGPELYCPQSRRPSSEGAARHAPHCAGGSRCVVLMLQSLPHSAAAPQHWSAALTSASEGGAASYKRARQRPPILRSPLSACFSTLAV